MALTSLQDLYVDELRDLYNAERQILRSLPKMIDAACDPELKDALHHHLDETHRQVDRIARIFDEMGITPRGKVCAGMKGILKEGGELLKEKADPAVKDAGLISVAQRVEHYEMAGYGTARTYAQMLGYSDAAQALQDTLNEEGNADHTLTQIAESQVNPQAGQQPVRADASSGLLRQDAEPVLYDDEGEGDSL